MSLSFPLQVSNWWSINNSLNVSRNKFSTPNLMGFPFESGRTAYNFNINQSFSISSTTTADLSFNYRSASVHGTYFIRPMYHTDLGIKKSFADKRITVSVAANDLFNTDRERIKSVIPRRSTGSTKNMKARFFALGFLIALGVTWSSLHGIGQRVPMLKSGVLEIKYRIPHQDEMNNLADINVTVNDRIKS